MKIGVIGLGRMGANIARRLMRGGHDCVVFDTSAKAVETLAAEGATGARDLAGLVRALDPPRVLWVMLPAGRITSETIDALGEMLGRDDVVIDGGNSFYRDDIAHAARLNRKGIHFVDVGTSGGVWGLERGYCMMIGGEDEVVRRLDPVFRTLAPGLGGIERTPGRAARDPRAELGYIHAGPNGAGHFVKMVHNGIEYGLMQAYAEGFAILRNRDAEALPEAERYDLDVADIAEVWRRGSVISSWLLDLTAAALARDGALTDYSGYVEDSGEGRWTINAAIEEAVPADVLTAALFARFRSRLDHTFGEKILSAMRQGFGGHLEQGHAGQGQGAQVQGGTTPGGAA
ncbi:MAG: 6-phosphogluconate dehydrogenase (decarboxylating) [Acidiphilium sp. 37-67-22]|nr:MAG: 6-phosphogluconate dehydrogenase (decarboxylating) [Acidiphilium sp. 37-67-22]